LCGPPQAGKSWLALGLAVAVASGGTTLGGRAVEPGGALYLRLEDGRRRLQSRLGRLLQARGLACPAGLFVATRWARPEEGGVAELDGWLAAHPGTRLVVLDTLPLVRERRAAARDLAAADYEGLVVFAELGGRHGAAVVAVQHVRRLAADGFPDATAATTGLAGAADVVLTLRRERGTALGALHVSGCDLDEDLDLELAWDGERLCWDVVGPSGEAAIEGAKRGRVAEVLARAGRPLVPRAVAEALGKRDERGRGAVRVLLCRMAKDGLLFREGGRYALTATTGAGVTGGQT
jgi:hypothetical protein